jgi:23S rRNA (guanine2445-N2)-methyltransferase / 23S rRNA (guanine2069-N7)-methyltransferase
VETARFALIAKTLFGLEGVLAEELMVLGAENITLGRRLVSFSGDQALLYRANLCCRTAIRILRPIATFPAADEQALYRGVQQIDWRQFLDRAGTLTIDPVVHNSFLTHSLYAAQLAKDAIVDQFRTRTGGRPSVDRDDPDLRINLHLNANQATVYLDASGDSLHKRGYRTAAGEAPINEVLAAGILRLAQWDTAMPLADFMCGSGTLVIEAALLARNIAPGLIRKHYGYMRWPDFDRDLHARLLAEARSLRWEHAPNVISGSDLDQQVIEAARRNALAAGVDRDVEFDVASFDAVVPSAQPGLLVTNPPYDERLRLSKVGGVYARIGAALRRHWGGWRACVFSGNLEAPRQMGMKPKRQTPLFNGPIECRLFEFDLRHKQRAATEAPLPAAEASPVIAKRTWHAQAAELQNRLRRMARHWGKWARRQEITCYRLYDRDVAEVPLTIDWYEGHLHIVEHERPHERTGIEHEQWLERMVAAAAETLNVEPDRVYFRARERDGPSRGGEAILQVVEGGYRFEVRLGDRAEPGLPLDQRAIRSLLGAEATGKRVLNLFGYTGAATVYAAGGGALATTTVDSSQFNLEWTRRNLELNGLLRPEHRLVRQPPLAFMRSIARDAADGFDLAIVQPPTLAGDPDEGGWDLQRDHAELLNLTLDRLARGGKCWFSTTSRRFKLDEAAIRRASIREISRQTVPPDFRNKRVHRCWLFRCGS